MYAPHLCQRHRGHRRRDQGRYRCDGASVVTDTDWQRPTTRDEAEALGLPNPAIRCTFCGAFGVVRLPTINDQVALCPDDDAELAERQAYAAELRQVNYPTFDFSPKSHPQRTGKRRR